PRPGQRHGVERRGAGALAPPAARHGLAGRLHPPRRGDGPHRAPRALRARGGVRRGGAVGRAVRRRRPRVSVNLSARQMASPRVLDDVLGALSRSGLDPARLQLEITESVLMEHHESSATVLSTLRSMGVTIAIDDFGTGYSSLAYLERLPVDIIKIDKAFVDRIDDGGRHAKLIKGILSLTHDLGLTAVAEGIETVNQLDALEA